MYEKNNTSFIGTVTSHVLTIATQGKKGAGVIGSVP